METFSQTHLGVPLNDTTQIIGFDNGDDMERFYVENNEAVWAGVSSFSLYYYSFIPFMKVNR